MVLNLQNQEPRRGAEYLSVLFLLNFKGFTPFNVIKICFQSTAKRQRKPYLRGNNRRPFTVEYKKGKDLHTNLKLFVYISRPNRSNRKLKIVNQDSKRE